MNQPTQMPHRPPDNTTKRPTSAPSSPPPTGAESVTAQAKEIASDVAGQAKSVATQIVTRAKDAVTSQVSEQKEKSANDLRDVAKALRDSSQALNDNMAAPLIGKAADHIEKVATYVRTVDARGLKRTVETFAKNEPLLFLGGAFALGIVGARFLKSAPHADAATANGPGGRA